MLKIFTIIHNIHFLSRKFSGNRMGKAAIVTISLFQKKDGRPSIKFPPSDDSLKKRGTPTDVAQGQGEDLWHGKRETDVSIIIENAAKVSGSFLSISAAI